jgi:hypothetical protein
MLLPRFDPPANIGDFTTAAQRNNWSKLISGFFMADIEEVESYPGVTSQFYDPTKTDTDAVNKEALISWPGFPRLVLTAHPGNKPAAWSQAEGTPDSRAQFQDEYLEWNVVRNAAGKITRVSFTCEGPEYWEFLAKTSPNKLLALYKQLVSPAHAAEVTLNDLIVGNVYKRDNRFNREFGAVHLIQPNNTLGAEINIAATATVIRKNAAGQVITDSDKLIRCAGFGAPGRSSDPKIGATINQLARQKFAITLKNPVGLYIVSFSSQGWKKPDGTAVGNYWRIVRGNPAPAPNKPAQVLHLVYEVPAAEGFVVGDIKIAGTPIQFGGQIAENINVGLIGVVCRQGQISNPAQPCGPPQTVAPHNIIAAATPSTARSRAHSGVPVTDPGNIV